MGRPKLLALAASVIAVMAMVPVLAASATAAPTPRVAAAAESPSLAGNSDMPFSRAFATRAEADAATAEVKKTYGNRLPSALAPGECVNSWIYLTESLGYFSHARADSTIRFTLSAGYAPCRRVTVGGSYNGCGHVGANRWILIPESFPGQVNPIWAGFVISACTTDP